MLDTITTSVFAALITGVIPLMGLIISKENIISEFRKDWIDGLRSDVADFIACAIQIQAKNKPQAALDQLPENYLTLNKKGNSIVMRIDKEEHPHYLKILDECHDILNVHPISFEKLDKKAEELRDATKFVIRAEWKKIEIGETFFRWARFVSAIIFIFIMIHLIVNKLI